MTSGQSERFSFERPWAALGLPAALPFKIRVGQIVSDGDRQTKQILDAAEQGCLDFVAMAHEKVGGPVKLHPAAWNRSSHRGVRRGALRSPSHRQVARSLPGAAIRARSGCRRRQRVEYH